MYSRITLLEFDPVRFDVGDALVRFEASVVPALQEQPGYEGALVLANDDAKDGDALGVAGGCRRRPGKRFLGRAGRAVRDAVPLAAWSRRL